LKTSYSEDPQRISLGQLQDSYYEAQHSEESILGSAKAHRNRHIARANSAFEVLLRNHPEGEVLLRMLWDELSDAEDIIVDATVEHCFVECQKKLIDTVVAR